MEYQIHFIGALAYVDEKLQDLKEDMGDLPEKVIAQEAKVAEWVLTVDETKNIIDEIKSFCATAKKTLVELKDKEENLATNQTNVSNNKEFDALTAEIQYVKEEHEKLSLRLRQEGVKEENLKNILADQENELENAQNLLKELNEEFELLAADQKSEIEDLMKKRAKIVKKIKPEFLAEYERIRTFHTDAAVRIIKDSCKGYRIPPQLVVEIRNNLDNIFTDENSGRILIPEEFVMADDMLKGI